MTPYSKQRSQQSSRRNDLILARKSPQSKVSFKQILDKKRLNAKADISKTLDQDALDSDSTFSDSSQSLKRTSHVKFGIKREKQSVIMGVREMDEVRFSGNSLTESPCTNYSDNIFL